MEDTFIYYGGALKTVDGEEGAVIGPMVTYYDGTHKDFIGDYFTKSTYLGARGGDGVDVLFHHGIPLAKGIEHLAQHIFSPVKAIKDDLQIWGKHVLDMADGYEKKVYDLVKKGKLGWSTGAVSHQVVREKDGELKRWLIGENSYTPMPCEPCNRIVAVKSLASEDFLKTVYGLESITLIGDYEFKSDTLGAGEPAKEISPDTSALKATSGAEIFTQNLTEQNQTFWRIENALCESARDIAKAAAAMPITGTAVDVSLLVSSAVDQFAVTIKSLITTQIKEWLDSDMEHEFYVKSALLDAVIQSPPVGMKFADRLDLVLAAVEKVTNDAKQISEMRAEQKAGRKISKARMSKLKEIMEQLEALMTEVEPMSADEDEVAVKAAADAQILSLAAQFEATKMQRTVALRK